MLVTHWSLVAVVGILFVLVRVPLFVWGAKTSQQVVTREYPHTDILYKGDFRIDGNKYRAILAPGLKQSDRITGECSVKDGKDVNFMFLDDDAKDAWSNRNSYTSVFSSSNSKGLSFDLIVPFDGNYYFVFDNAGDPESKQINLEATRNWVETGTIVETIVDDTLVMVGAVIATGGGLIALASGLKIYLRRTTEPDKDKGSQPQPKEFKQMLVRNQI